MDRERTVRQNAEPEPLDPKKMVISLVIMFLGAVAINYLVLGKQERL